MRVNSSTPKSVSANTFAPELTLDIVVFHAFKALLSKPTLNTVVSEIPDVLVLPEMVRAKNVSGIGKNGDRHENKLGSLLNCKFWLVDMLQNIPHRQRAPLVGVEVSECAPLIQPGNASRINIIAKRSRSGRNELTGTDTNVQNRSMIVTFHQLNSGLR